MIVLYSADAARFKTEFTIIFIIGNEDTCPVCNVSLSLPFDIEQ